MVAVLKLDVSLLGRKTSEETVSIMQVRKDSAWMRMKAGQP